MNFELGANVFPNNMDYFSIELCVIGYVTTSISRFEVSMFNNRHANVRIATMLTSLFRWLSFEVNEKYWPQFIGHVPVFNPLFTSSKYQKYIPVADVTTQGDAIRIPECQEIKCLCEQQKQGLFSDWPENEATISNDLLLQSGQPYNWKHWWSLNLAV